MGGRIEGKGAGSNPVILCAKTPSQARKALNLSEVPLPAVTVHTTNLIAINLFEEMKPILDASLRPENLRGEVGWGFFGVSAISMILVVHG